MSVSPAVIIKYIQAAKDGNVDSLKKFIEDGVPVNTVDKCGILHKFIIRHFIGQLQQVNLKLSHILFSLELI